MTPRPTAPAQADAHLEEEVRTAFARAEDRERALAAGFDDHVAKPIDPEQLIRALAQAIRRLPEHLPDENDSGPPWRPVKIDCQNA